MKNYLLVAVAAMSMSEVMIIRAGAADTHVRVSAGVEVSDWRDTTAAVVFGGASAANIAHLLLSSATAVAPGGTILARVGASIVGGATAIWFARSKPFLRSTMKKRSLEKAQTALGRAVDRATLAAESASQTVVDNAIVVKDKVKEAAGTVRDKVGDAMTATRNKTASVLETAAEKVKTDKNK